jgi:hypothetical protein
MTDGIKKDLGYRLAARKSDPVHPWAVLNPDGYEIACSHGKRDAKLIVEALNSQQLAAVARRLLKTYGRTADTSRSAVKIARRGRPRIDEERIKEPWRYFGMSQRTWYRRKAEERRGRSR